MPLAHAIQAQYSFDRSAYYQGENGTVTIILYNDNPLFQWYIRTAGIQFDWQKSQNIWFAKSVELNIASGQSYTLTVEFGIDNGVSVANHSFEIKYVGSFNDYNTVARGILYVRDVYEKLAIEQRLIAEPKLQYAQSVVSDAESQIGSARFVTSGAQNILSQAQQMLALAKANLAQAKNACDAGNSAFASGLFRQAYDSFTQCSSLADAAVSTAGIARQQLQSARDVETQASNPLSSANSPNLAWLFWLVVGLIVAAIIGGLAIQASKHTSQQHAAGTGYPLAHGFAGTSGYCPHCRATVPRDALFCHKCGRSQQ